MSGELAPLGMKAIPCRNPLADDEPKIELFTTVQVELKRYEDLVKKEARLELLEKALCNPNAYVSDIKRLFSLEGAAD